MGNKITVEMSEIEYEEFKKWKSFTSFSFQKMNKRQFYEFVKTQVPKDLIDSDEISQDDSLETFVESYCYSIIANANKPDIDFDIENFDCSNEWSHVKTGWDEKHGWLAFMAGGDWEIPVFGVLYSDGLRIQCYVPKAGNCLNEAMMCAWQEEPDFLEGKDVKDMYNLDLMIEDIENHLNIGDEK